MRRRDTVIARGKKGRSRGGGREAVQFRPCKERKGKKKVLCPLLLSPFPSLPSSKQQHPLPQTSLSPSSSLYSFTSPTLSLLPPFPSIPSPFFFPPCFDLGERERERERPEEKGRREADD